MPDLLSTLTESLLLVRLRKLTVQVNKLQQAQGAGKLGPRVVRARVRRMQQERRDLVRLARRCGYNIES